MEKTYYIAFYGTSGDGLVGYDYEPCNSLDMAMLFTSKTEAERKRTELQPSWASELRVEEFVQSVNEL